MYLSTLRSYIEALGGELEVSARFDDCFVRLNQFAEIEVQTEPEGELAPTIETIKTS
jgi:hypothetical protein